MAGKKTVSEYEREVEEVYTRALAKFRNEVEAITGDLLNSIGEYYNSEGERRKNLELSFSDIFGSDVLGDAATQYTLNGRVNAQPIVSSIIGKGISSVIAGSGSKRFGRLSSSQSLENLVYTALDVI